MERTGNVVKTVMFVLIGILLFLLVQNILMPKEQENYRDTFYSMDILGADTYEVIFLGTSHIYNGISPMKIYEDVGVTTINLGTSAQHLDESYYLLKSVLEDQHPSVVVLDASSLFNKLEEMTVNRRFLLDSLPLGTLKVELAQAYALGEDSSGMEAALVPMLQYHSAWDEVTSQSFKMQEMSFDYLFGYMSGARVSAASLTQEQIDGDAKALRDRTNAYSISVSDGKRTDAEFDDVLYEPEISEENLSYLLKIKTLCEENGAELLLTKIPTRMSAIDYSGAWTICKSEMTKEIAQRYGIAFFDLTYDSDLKLDYTTDTVDGGAHLNIRGAEKATECLWNYLEQNYALEKRQNRYYDESLEKYEKLREAAYLKTEMDFGSYLERLAELENTTIIISAKNEFVGGLDAQDYRLMQKLGLQLPQEGQIGDAHVAVIDDGEVVYEEVSNRKIEYEYSYDEDTQIAICSAGYWYHGRETSIEINGKEYSADGIGWNIVVLYKDTDQVIDSVNFDTSTAEKCARHYTDVTTLPDLD